MLVNIFGMLIFVTGIQYPADLHGCQITTNEKNTEYSTGASCDTVLDIITEEQAKNDKRRH